MNLSTVSFFSTVSENPPTKLKREPNEIVRLPSFAKNRQTFVLWEGGGGGGGSGVGVMFALDASLSNLTRLPMLRRSFLRCRQIFVKLSSLLTLKKKPWKGL